MKKNKVFIIILIIILVVLGFWYLSSTFSDREADSNLSSQEQESLKSCQDNGGIWLKDRQFCHIYSPEIAEFLQENCENFNGEWLSDSRKYECIINDELWQYGDWEMINWDSFNRNKQSCLEVDGTWLGGVNEACELNGDIFYRGTWENLEALQNSCINEFGGEWLGGENVECKIDDVIYPGNWVQAFTLKDSCEEASGTWLGGDSGQCKVGSYIYENQAWERLEEMKTSCENSGGVFKGGAKFRCDIGDTVYYNKNWERISKADTMGQSCKADGGTWESEARTCSGLSLDWCGNINEELELGGLGWKETSLSCYIY